MLNNINIKELNTILKKLSPIQNKLCPDINSIFIPFKLCTPQDCRVVILGQSPYPQKGIATGLAFANNPNTQEDKIPPSLRVLRNSCIDYTKVHNYPLEFDLSLESWAKQGVLLLNSALTTEINNTDAHILLWRPFMISLLSELSKYNNNIIFALLGNQAKSFKGYIKSNFILEENHPSYYARLGKDMPSDIFHNINKIMKYLYNEKIAWYKEPLYEQ